MNSPRLPRRPARRPSRRRRDEILPSTSSRTSPFATPPPRAPIPLSVDAQRYAAFRAGVSKEELAARENCKLSTIESSIERMEIEREVYSQEAVELANRRTVLAAAPAREASLLSMLTATKEKLVHLEGDPNQPRYVEAPDHAIQLQAISALNALIESLKANAPLIDARQQNNLQQNFHPGAPGGLSAEFLIRQVREEKGLALPIDTAPENAEDSGPLPDTIDFELASDLAKAAELEEMEGGGSEDETQDEAQNGDESSSK